MDIGGSEEESRLEFHELGLDNGSSSLLKINRQVVT